MQASHVLIVSDDVELIRGGELDECPHAPFGGIHLLAGEPVSKWHRARTAELRIGGATIAATVKINERLRRRADEFDYVRAVERAHESRVVPVRAVASVTKSGALQSFIGTPRRQESGDPF